MWFPLPLPPSPPSLDDIKNISRHHHCRPLKLPVPSKAMVAHTVLLDFTVSSSVIADMEKRSGLKSAIANVLAEHFAGLKPLTESNIDGSLLVLYTGPRGSLITVRGYTEGLITLNIEYYKQDDQEALLTFEQWRYLEADVAMALNSQRSKRLPPVRRGTIYDLYLTLSASLTTRSSDSVLQDSVFVLFNSHWFDLMIMMMMMMMMIIMMMMMIMMVMMMMMIIMMMTMMTMMITMMVVMMMMMAGYDSWPKNWKRRCRQQQPLHGRTRLLRLNAVDPLRDTFLPPTSDCWNMTSTSSCSRLDRRIRRYKLYTPNRWAIYWCSTSCKTCPKQISYTQKR
ncbi:uncharacterized protein LOC105201107 isoform X5 [Solenopsis invicta]|uniref:uncharacterized protein LOC105201107 isoform X5 n=1 Tax=Solenopsis invicta TaxID=13686 RepID=UPI00193E287D|nr:uncharacterized protein LOC105201107 isoform X5 [Solenopsis invicta]